MAENRPPRRLGPHPARSGEPYLDDRERINRARQAAEALFAPKPPTPKVPVSPVGPGSEQKSAAALVPPGPVPASPEPVVSAIAPKPPPGVEIPAAQLARIRTWVKYGMTAAQVAEVYRVPVGAIERVLRKT